jgi:parallel beta-helix repeat protein
MKKAPIVMLLALFIFGCGNDKPTNNGIVVSIDPSRVLLNLGASFQFTSYVYGIDDDSVSWAVVGSPDNGVITQTGNYSAPSILPTNVDSVRIIARLKVDSTKFGVAWAVLSDPNKIYISSLGSDTSGTGTRWQPYRTITRALYRAQSGQLIIVGPGQYDLAAGERFPLFLTSGIGVQGAGSDSAVVIGPSGTDPQRDAIFILSGVGITLEKLRINSVNSAGIAVSVRSGLSVQISRNEISRNRIGVYAFGSAGHRPILESNIIKDDSIGVVVADSSGPILRNNTVDSCYVYGLDIRDLGEPDLGRTDSTNTGDNIFQNCGNDGCHWLINNASPDTIWAIGNTGPNGDPLELYDGCIYDDEESDNVSGPVMFFTP